MSHRITDKLKPSQDVGSQELTEEYIRLRAYELFEERGYEHGHDVEDWLQAEFEVTGKKRPESNTAKPPALAAVA